MKPDKSKLFLPWHHNDSGLINGAPIHEESESYPFIADTATISGDESDDDCLRADFITRAANTHFQLFEALQLAEGFISGFEGDDAQEGIEFLLAVIRNAIVNTEGQS